MPDGMLPQGPMPSTGGGASPGTGGGMPPAGLLALLGGQGALGGIQGAPMPGGASPLSALMPMMAGIGFQQMLAQITKFMKTISTVGTRGEKSTRVPMQANVGQLDQLAMRQQLAQQAMAQAPQGLPAAGPAQLPIARPPMLPMGQ